ncbi:MAG: NAD-binding protein, partial [Rhodoplanes sp.]
ALRAHGLSYVVVESDRKLAEKLRSEGTRVVYGDATREEVLAAALPRSARLIVVALPDAFQARQVISLARKLNPEIETVVRTHSEAEALYLSCRVGGGIGGHGRTRDCGGHVRLRPAAPRRRCPHGPQHRRPPARKQRSRRGC